MGKTIRDVCHDWFYDGGYFNKHYMNVSYDDDCFYSYGTAIARLATTRTGGRICLISLYSHSNTTNKHLSYLRTASPYETLNIPTNYGSRFLDDATIIETFFADLNYWRNQKLTQWKNRTMFIDLFFSLERFLDLFGYELNDTQKEFFQEHKELYDTLNSSDGVKKLKEKQRQETIQKAKAFKELCANNNLTELAQMAYGAYLPAPTNAEKAKLREKLNPNKIYSYVWHEKDCCYHTSQHIAMPQRDGDIFLKRLHAGKAKRGDTVGKYTVMAITDDAVKIGCHLIPMQNLKELYEQMVAREKAQEDSP